MKLNKRTIVLVALALLVTAAIGVTVAYLIDRTPEVENTFVPSRVACTVVSNTDYVYAVENTGDTDAYVRVAVVVNWKNTVTGNIHAQAPQFDVTPESGWEKGSDGYYYYRNPLNIDERITTTALQVIPKSDAPGSEYTLSVEIVASAIQATVDAVKNWSSGVASATSDGAALTVKTQ